MFITTIQCQIVKIEGKGKGAYSSSWIGNPSQRYGASPATWDHTVLPATCHKEIIANWWSWNYTALLTVEWLNGGNIVWVQRHDGVVAVIPGEHERASYVGVTYAERVTDLMRRHRQQVCACNHTHTNCYYLSLPYLTCETDASTRQTPSAEDTSRSIEPLWNFGKPQEEKSMDVTQRIQWNSKIS